MMVFILGKAALGTVIEDNMLDVQCRTSRLHRLPISGSTGDVRVSLDLCIMCPLLLALREDASSMGGVANMLIYFAQTSWAIVEHVACDLRITCIDRVVGAKLLRSASYRLFMQCRSIIDTGRCRDLVRRHAEIV